MINLYRSVISVMLWAQCGEYGGLTAVALCQRFLILTKAGLDVQNWNQLWQALLA